MRRAFRRVGRALGRNGSQPAASRAPAGRLLIAGLISLLLLSPVFGQSNGGPLSIQVAVEVSQAPDVLRSHILQVSWEISGGTGPYQLRIAVLGPDGNEQSEDGGSLAGMRSFNLLAPAGGMARVDVHVVDATGATATGETSVSLIPMPSLPPAPSLGLSPCSGVAFSTEEDFVTFGPEPPDGNPIISDGDLLGAGCVVCARNHDLLNVFDVREDLGLDAVDLIDVRRGLVVFSTELDSPHSGQFTAGDLLATNGAIIPNAALLAAFPLRAGDLGLDAVHLVGDPEQIIMFLDYVQKMSSAYWTTSGALQTSLARYEIDIWFSTEGTAPSPTQPAFLDGDLLSARDGIIVARNALLLPAGMPAGIPDRGTDYGLDAVTAMRLPMRESIHFSTELTHRFVPHFTDGDVLLIQNGVVMTHHDLIRCFEPAARFAGLDALFIAKPG